MVKRPAIGWGQASTLRASPSPQPSPIEGEGGAHSGVGGGVVRFHSSDEVGRRNDTRDAANDDER